MIVILHFILRENRKANSLKSVFREECRVKDIIEGYFHAFSLDFPGSLWRVIQGPRK